MVEGTGLENRHAETYRGFESHPLRQEKTPTGRKTSRGFLLVEERWDGIMLSVYQRQTSHLLSTSLF